MRGTDNQSAWTWTLSKVRRLFERAHEPSFFLLRCRTPWPNGSCGRLSPAMPSVSGCRWPPDYIDTLIRRWHPPSTTPTTATRIWKHKLQVRVLVGGWGEGPEAGPPERP